MVLYYIIAVTDRDRGAKMAALFHESGLTMTMTKLARGTAPAEQLSVLGLGETEKSIVSGVAGPQQLKAIFLAARRQLMIDIPGNGIMMAVPLKSVAGGRTLQYLTDNPMTGGRPDMHFSHELIIVILNEGYADDVMDAARSAGATGGTVLHAKGTGASRDRSFFGVNIADEKDMIYIVAYSDEKAAVMKAISEQTGPGTKAGAICFSLPISAVAGLRAREESILPGAAEQKKEDEHHDPAE